MPVGKFRLEELFRFRLQFDLHSPKPLNVSSSSQMSGWLGIEPAAKVSVPPTKTDCPYRR